MASSRALKALCEREVLRGWGRATPFSMVAREGVLEEVAFEGEPVQLPAGAVLYYPEPGQTLWDVARRYRVSEEALRAHNPDEKPPLLVYRRLTGF